MSKIYTELQNTSKLDGIPTKLKSSNSGEPPIKNLLISPIGFDESGLHVETEILWSPGDDGMDT